VHISRDAYFDILDFVYVSIKDIKCNKPVREVLRKVLGRDEEGNKKKKIGFEVDCRGLVADREEQVYEEIE